MATIPSSGGANTAVSTPLVVTDACALQGVPVAGSASDPAEAFTQLIAEMLGTTDAAPQSPPAALQDLTTIDSGTGGDERETTVATDDHESGNLAIAALLQGLAPFLPIPPATPPSGDSSTATDAIAALIAQGGDIDVSKAAVDTLTSDPTDAAGNAPTTDAGTTTRTADANAAPPAQMHALLTAHTAAGDVDVTPDATLRAPIGTHAWKDELGTQLTWMAMNGREAASLRLSPEHLGPLEIRISMHEGEASVYFGAANPDTRSAIEQSMPRLRELFASQGLVLADAGVSRDAPRNAFKPSPQSGGPRSVSDAAADSPVKSVTLTRLGLIDTYV